MMNAHDRQLIADAVRTVEQNTSGELVCVLAQASSSYSYIPFLWATLVAMTVPWILALTTNWSSPRLLGAQILIFMLFYLLFSLRSLRMVLVPRKIKRTRAYRAAVENFFSRGLTHAPHRSGVLIYVSLAERYIRIIADTGISSKVNQREWQLAVNAFTTNMAQNRITEGFLETIALCGQVLAAYAPADGSERHLSDHIYIIQ